jgi:hypothetical protein
MQQQRHNPEDLHLNLHPEDGGSMEIWKAGILPQHYTASQARRLRLETSPLWEPRNNMTVLILRPARIQRKWCPSRYVSCLTYEVYPKVSGLCR